MNCINASSIKGQGYIVVKLQVLASVIFLSVLVAAAPAQAASGDAGIHYTKIVVEPEGPDFHVTVYYNTGFMTRVFSLLFGTGSLKAAITAEVAGFGDIELQSLDTSNEVASFIAYNQSSCSDGWYMYDANAKLPVQVDQLEISGKALDRPIIINDATEVPDFFYQ
ncbi:hypothetical protein [Methanocella arvoryzae]|uniref:Uncharacterized protein n=1 Tax=Methanocella arvoryzae (strain DSM 22066 / NBRC 105507 / MRE50) TaxID=351160 RepID=Q0W3K5_METAR|nr:hypothetical protein [Methanocella arvoryzae]CAJ37038.1 hypothetical protein RCIX1857 [Methanocella arvoryzae MRE50]